MLLFTTARYAFRTILLPATLFILPFEGKHKNAASAFPSDVYTSMAKHMELASHGQKYAPYLPHEKSQQLTIPTGFSAHPGFVSRRFGASVGQAREKVGLERRWKHSTWLVLPHLIDLSLEAELIPDCWALV
ncbi:hypothetical protein F5148DRAFT_837217 [Russula earlei]|uniref:Uncharacterized protein n=1 Tax=Russula earlei TaxID=71964 RepID=A0ACC0UB19_9AGAM|nr:hypothetical protein F5148DRAFT_837217 [Russula earlei]